MIKTLRVASIGVVFIVFALLSLNSTVFASGETFGVVANKTTLQNQSVAITDLQISGTGNDLLDMNLYVPSGVLSFDSTAGLTFTGSNSGVNLQFRGSRSDINTALATLTYKSSSAVIQLDNN